MTGAGPHTVRLELDVNLAECRALRASLRDLAAFLGTEADSLHEQLAAAEHRFAGQAAQAFRSSTTALLSRTEQLAEGAQQTGHRLQDLIDGLTTIEQRFDQLLDHARTGTDLVVHLHWVALPAAPPEDDEEAWAEHQTTVAAWNALVGEHGTLRATYDDLQAAWIAHLTSLGAEQPPAPSTQDVPDASPPGTSPLPPLASIPASGGPAPAPTSGSGSGTATGSAVPAHPVSAGSSAGSPTSAHLVAVGPAAGSVSLLTEAAPALVSAAPVPADGPVKCGTTLWATLPFGASDDLAVGSMLLDDAGQPWVDSGGHLVIETLPTDAAGLPLCTKTPVGLQPVTLVGTDASGAPLLATGQQALGVAAVTDGRLALDAHPASLPADRGAAETSLASRLSATG